MLAKQINEANLVSSMGAANKEAIRGLVIRTLSVRHIRGDYTLLAKYILGEAAGHYGIICFSKHLANNGFVGLFHISKSGGTNMIFKYTSNPSIKFYKVKRGNDYYLAARSIELDVASVSIISMSENHSVFEVVDPSSLSEIEEV